MTATSRATLPAIPRKVVLTPEAKAHIANAVRDTGHGQRRFILDMTQPNGWLQVLPELLDNNIVTRGRSLDWDTPVYVLTDFGMWLRTYLLDNRVMRHLAELVRTEGLSGEDLADIAAYLDDEPGCEGHADDDFVLTSGVGAGESVYCDGSCIEYVGPGEEFLRLLRHVAQWSGESAEDLRQELETYLGWND